MSPKFLSHQLVWEAVATISFHAVEDDFEFCLREVAFLPRGEDCVWEVEHNEAIENGDVDCECAFDSVYFRYL